MVHREARREITFCEQLSQSWGRPCLCVFFAGITCTRVVWLSDTGRSIGEHRVQIVPNALIVETLRPSTRARVGSKLHHIWFNRYSPLASRDSRSDARTAPLCSKKLRIGFRGFLRKMRFECATSRKEAEFGSFKARILFGTSYATLSKQCLAMCS